VAVKFVKPTTDLVEAIAADMRQQDIDEVWASDRKTPLDALRMGWEASHRSVIVMIDDVPCVMIGLVIHDILSGSGVPWLLGTDSALKHRREFITLVPQIIDEMLDTCPRLHNYVHVDNTVSVRWLKRIGFTLDPPIPYGRGGEMFHKFYLERA